MAAFFISARPEGITRRVCSMSMNFSAKDVAEMTSIQIIEGAAGFLDEAAVALIAAINAVKQGDFEQSKAAVQAMKDYKTALDWMMSERNRLERDRRTTAGAIGASEMDLGAARDEIGRRLACLRDAGTD
ncbi:hypothetical protein [Pseudotabrizicola sp. L79]|uniref:hypothetical protein n=1 Tax=Pseudotabrizicola sp. L79 TaxID=3118402 RepID=UPI002F95BD25